MLQPNRINLFFAPNKCVIAEVFNGILYAFVFLYNKSSSWELVVWILSTRRWMFVFSVLNERPRAQLKLIIKKLIEVTFPEWPIRKLSMTFIHYARSWRYVCSDNVPRSIFAQPNWFNKLNSNNKFSLVHAWRFQPLKRVVPPLSTYLCLMICTKTIKQHIFYIPWFSLV